MNITDSIKRSVSNKTDVVFLRSDFKSFGGDSQVNKALGELQSKGALVKLGVGVYAKAKRSVVSGNPIPLEPLEVLAPKVLKKLGVAVQPSRQTTAYNAGTTNQVPTGVVLNIGRRRIGRKLSFNGKLVQYERATERA